MRQHGAAGLRLVSTIHHPSQIALNHAEREDVETAAAVDDGNLCSTTRPAPAADAAEGRPSPQLAALCLAARLHNIAADPHTLAHQLGIAANDRVSTGDLLRAAWQLG